jgi:hypothetical protein
VLITHLAPVQAPPLSKPDSRQRGIFGRQNEASWNYTSVLNVAFLAMASVLVWRFFSTGGVEMPRKMGGSPADPHAEGESSQALPVHDA